MLGTGRRPIASKRRTWSRPAAGDSVRPVVRVTNNRDEPIACRIKLELPEGWKAENPEAAASVAPGEAKDVELPFTIAFAEALGFKDVKIVVSEGEEAQADDLEGVRAVAADGPGQPDRRPAGQDASDRRGRQPLGKAMSGALRMHVPGSWKALTPEIPIAELKPQEVRPVVCKFQWSADWKPQETAQIELDFGADKRVTRPLIPNQYAIHRAKEHQDRRPAERLGAGDATARLDAGFQRGRVRRRGPPGLGQGRHLRRGRGARLEAAGERPQEFLGRRCAGAVRRHGRQQDSRVQRSRATTSSGSSRLPDANRVYLGRWKMQNEIPATRYDHSRSRASRTRTADGYVMEFLLPAAQIANYHPEVGGRLGLNLNLTIQGKQASREAYWPSPKKSGVTTNPDRWGTVLLLE